MNQLVKGNNACRLRDRTAASVLPLRCFARGSFEEFTIEFTIGVLPLAPHPVISAPIYLSLLYSPESRQLNNIQSHHPILRGSAIETDSYAPLD